MRLSWWRGHNNARYRVQGDIYSPSFPTGANGNNFEDPTGRKEHASGKGVADKTFLESGNWAGGGDQGGAGMKRMPPLLGNPENFRDPSE